MVEGVVLDLVALEDFLEKVTFEVRMMTRRNEPWKVWGKNVQTRATTSANS